MHPKGPTIWTTSGDDTNSQDERMAKYYVNNAANENGDHDVHVETCPYLPKDVNSLGSFSSCQVALAAARYFYHSANGCYWCCRKCHRVGE